MGTPQIVGNALREISSDPDVLQALFQVLETQRLLESDARVTFLPTGGDGSAVGTLLAASAVRRG